MCSSLMPHFALVLSFREIGEEAAMVFFEVGVAMVAGGQHELGVKVDPETGVVVSGGQGELVEQDGELEIEGVFAFC